MADHSQLPFLIKLLDDESEGTQTALQTAFEKFKGDISDGVASLAIDLSPEDRFKISALLHSGRRARLAQEWLVPSHLDDDWESFEHLLRILCDFMHDGIALRSSLSDNLDILADDVERRIASLTVNKLRKYLFEDSLFSGPKEDYYALYHSDLCYALETGKANPISLCMIFQLVAQRLDLEVTACNYPGHFLARVHFDNKAHLVDCYNQGRLIPVEELLIENKTLSNEAKFAIHHPAPPRVILHRVLRNMEHAFHLQSKTEDVLLLQKLQSSLVT